MERRTFSVLFVINKSKTSKKTGETTIIARISVYVLRNQHRLLSKTYPVYNSWASYNSKSLEQAIDRNYTGDLSGYKFDKTECMTCQNNTLVQMGELFTGDSAGCGKCTNRSCLIRKNGDYMTEQARIVADRIPKVAVIGNANDSLSIQQQNMHDEGIEFKAVNTYNLSQYPQKPVEPKAESFKKTEEFESAKEKYGKGEQERP